MATATTALSADDLLGLTKALEWRAGRRPGPRRSPRPLDIDLLLYGDETSDRPELRLPHPRLEHRRFVLQPLADLAPELRSAALAATPRLLLAAIEDPGDLTEMPWPWRDRRAGSVPARRPAARRLVARP